MRSATKFFLLLILSALLVQPAAANQPQYDDSDSLMGIEKSKTVFDINIAEPAKLSLYLKVIAKTRGDLVAQNVTPEIVLAFRGPAVRLISSETWAFSEEDQQSLAESALLIDQLRAEGVKLEACSIATDLFKVDNSTLLPGIKVVGNTFVSLTGYQGRGYALVPIM
jgi:intracellular sulfur oxidation DsrE/DsrF family protein